MSDEDNSYSVGGCVVGIPVFLGCWIYAIQTYGWFLGGGLGWIPSFFIGLLAGLLWPFIALGLIGVLLWWKGTPEGTEFFKSDTATTISVVFLVVVFGPMAFLHLRKRWLNRKSQ